MKRGKAYQSILCLLWMEKNKRIINCFRDMLMKEEIFNEILFLRCRLSISIVL